MTARALRDGYAGIWAATIAGAGLAALGLAAVDVPRPRPTLHAQLGTMLELLSHNAPVALWPLALVALEWPRIPVARRAGDALIAAQLAGHGLLVGAALGDEPGLWRYLPHLPLEWLAIALPAAAWLTARTRTTDGDVSPSGVLPIAGACLAALVAAALTETYATPSR